MPAPTLSAQQIAQLNADKLKQESYAATMTNSLANKNKRIDELEVSDLSFKQFFDYYNGIVGAYEDERKAIDGQYIEDPIAESDILGPATIDGSVRTTPTLPQTDILRVDEFDGGPLVQEESLYEQKHIQDQALVEDHLVNGYSFTGSLNLTTVTTSTLTSASTTLGLSDTFAYTINVNDIFAVTDGNTAAMVKALVIPPGMVKTISIEVIIPPVGSMLSASNVKEYDGFDNTERTSKSATDADLQPIMDALIVMLSEQLGERDDRMTEQLAALNSNEDPEQSNIEDAITNIELSKSFIENYLIGMDISDTGISSLLSNRNTRSTQLTTRLSQIETDVEVHYDPRYEMANNRGNTSRGTLRIQKATEGSLSETQKLIQTAQDQIAAIDDLLAL